MFEVAAPGLLPAEDGQPVRRLLPARRPVRRHARATRTALGAFGEDIGLAFQLLDDVLDVSGPAERTGKPRGTDLLDGTVTLPLILARGRDPGLAASTCARGHDAGRGGGAVRADRCDRRAGRRARDGARARGDGEGAPGPARAFPRGREQALRPGRPTASSSDTARSCGRA